MKLDLEIGYILTGDTRRILDMWYVFHQLISIVAVVGNKKAAQQVNLPSWDWADVNKEQWLIVCKKRSEKEESEINKKTNYGLENRWIWAEAFFCLLDDLYLQEYSKKRCVYLWGAGGTTKRLLQKIQLSVQGIIDSDAEKDTIQSFFGKYMVLSPKMVDFKRCFVLISSIYYDEISSYLEKEGMTEGIDYIDQTIIDIWPSEMMRQIFYADVGYNFRCRSPFVYEYIRTNGSIYRCCKMNISIGNLLSCTYEQICRSIKLRLALLSFINGTHAFCTSLKCQSILNHKEKNNVDDVYNTSFDTTYQRVVDPAFDRSCNLFCSSCRVNRIVDRRKELETLTEKFITEVVPKSDIIELAGMGEVFASKYLMKILTAPECKNKGLRVVTNGNICDRQLWSDLCATHDGNIAVTVSVDAAYPETYALLRRGGDFKKVEDSIRFFGKLREEDKILELRLCFTIQKNNYREIVPFVEWGIQHGVDMINFKKLENWGTYSSEEFQAISLIDSKTRELLPVLKDEITKLHPFREKIKIEFDDVDMIARRQETFWKTSPL